MALNPIEALEEAITGKRKDAWKLREEQRKKSEIVEYIKYYLQSSSGEIFTKIVVDDPIGCIIESESTYTKIYRHDKDSIYATKIENTKYVKYKKAQLKPFCKGVGQALSKSVKIDFNLKIYSDRKSVISIDDNELSYCIPLPEEESAICSYKKLTIKSEKIEYGCIKSYLDEDGVKSVEILCPKSSVSYMGSGVEYKNPFYYREYTVDISGKSVKAIEKRFYIPKFTKYPLDDKSSRWKLNEARNRMMDGIEKEAKEARDK